MHWGVTGEKKSSSCLRQGSWYLIVFRYLNKISISLIHSPYTFVRKLPLAVATIAGAPADANQPELHKPWHFCKTAETVSFSPNPKPLIWKQNTSQRCRPPATPPHRARRLCLSCKFHPASSQAYPVAPILQSFSCPSIPAPLEPGEAPKGSTLSWASPKDKARGQTGEAGREASIHPVTASSLAQLFYEEKRTGEPLGIFFLR